MYESLPNTKTLLALACPKPDEPRFIRTATIIFDVAAGLAMLAIPAAVASRYWIGWQSELYAVALLLVTGCQALSVCIVIAAVIFSPRFFKGSLTQKLCDQLDVRLLRHNGLAQDWAKRYALTDLSLRRRAVTVEAKLSARFLVGPTVFGAIAAAAVGLAHSILPTGGPIYDQIVSIIPPMVLAVAIVALLRHDFETQLLQLDYVLGEAEIIAALTPSPSILKDSLPLAGALPLSSQSLPKRASRSRHRES